MMEVITNHGAVPLPILFPGGPKQRQGAPKAAIFRACATLGSFQRRLLQKESDQLRRLQDLHSKVPGKEMLKGIDYENKPADNIQKQHTQGCEEGNEASPSRAEGNFSSGADIPPLQSTAQDHTDANARDDSDNSVDLHAATQGLKRKREIEGSEIKGHLKMSKQQQRVHHYLTITSSHPTPECLRSSRTRTTLP